MSEKVLIFGANFSIATRIADLAKRDFEVVMYEFSASVDSGRKEVSTAFTGRLLTDALAIHEARYVVFTSESLLYTHSPSILLGLVNELSSCKRLTGIHLTFVDIAEPIVTETSGRIEVLQGDSAYCKRLALLREALIGVADSVIKVQSVYTPQEDLWGQNFLHRLFDASDVKPIEVREPIGDWEALSADEVARTLISQLGLAGTTRLSHGPFCGGLQAFCNSVAHEYVSWVVSLASPRAKNDSKDLFLAYRESASSRADVHAAVRQTHCAVNYLYRKAPEESFGGRSVARFREELGKALARTIPLEVVENLDAIVPVPETGKAYAQGLALGLGLPYVEAIYKADRRRSFDIESFDERREFLFSRLSVAPGLLTGKSVMVVDEAIFTGATLKVVSHLLREEGVKCIYFAIPSPEARYRCNFNMQPKRALLSEYVRKEDLWSYFNVRGVFFQDDEAFVQSIEQDGPQCMACFIQRGTNDQFS